MRIPELMASVVAVAIAAGCSGELLRSVGNHDENLNRKLQPAVAGPRYPRGEACRQRALEKATVQEIVRSNIVRIVTESGSSTGFVVASPRKDELLIVTNAFAVGDGVQISAFMEAPSGKSLGVAGLEVVLDAWRSGLVILRTTRMSGAPRGLLLNPAGVRQGQDVVALGYAVAGSTADLSFEAGKISALNREVEGRTYLQTDINLNPGNNGGPVVDACGAVVGVVTAVLTQARRIGLIVSGEHVLALYDRYVAPRDRPVARIHDRVATLEQALEQGKGDEASEVFSRQFLWNTVWHDFLQFLEQAKAQEDRYAAEMRKAGMVYADEPFEKRAQFLSGLLPHRQYMAWYVGQAIALHWMSNLDALHAFLAVSPLLPNIFGGLTSLGVVDVVEESKASAVARVQIVTKQRTTTIRLYDFQWQLEVGDWHIAKMTCVSGCNR